MTFSSQRSDIETAGTATFPVTIKSGPHMRNQNAERRISGSLNWPMKPAAQASVKAVQPAAGLRHQRRVHACRPALLEPGRRSPQDRPAPGPGARDARRATRCRRRRAVRLRLHRCRQDRLRRLLRTLPATAAPGRAGGHRQHAVERQRGAACGRRRHGGAAAAQHEVA